MLGVTKVKDLDPGGGGSSGYWKLIGISSRVFSLHLPLFPEKQPGACAKGQLNRNGSALSEPVSVPQKTG